MSRRLLPPVRGAADFNASADTPPDAFPPHGGRNFRNRTGVAQRLRPGKRPGLTPTFAAAIGGGNKVQLLDVIAKAAGTTYALGQNLLIDGGESMEAGALLGQAWFLDANRGMFRSFRDPYPAAFGATSPTPGNYGCFACSWHPDGEQAAILSIVSKDYGGATGDQVISHVSMINPDTNALAWHTEIEDKDPGGAVPTTPRWMIANSVRVYATFTYVSVGPYIYVLRTVDGVYIKRHALNNWSLEVMDTRMRPDGTVVALYWGNPSIAGPVVGDTYYEGAYFRAGIALFGVTTDTTVNGTPLTPSQFGVKKTAGYTYYEDHVHYRFSEKSLATPRGCYPQGLGIGADGSLVVGRTNQGFGPTTAFPPNAVVSPSITLCKITPGNATAAMDWERDSDSELNNWEATGWWNDIGVDADGQPIGTPAAGPEQSIVAVAVSQTTGDIFAAGKRVNGFCVYGLRGDDGIIKWKSDLGGTIFQHCIAVDPVTGLVVVCGTRNDDWIDPETGAASGVMAHLWWLDPDTGEVRFHYDLDEEFATDGATPAGAFSLDVSSTGRLVYTTVHIG